MRTLNRPDAYREYFDNSAMGVMVRLAAAFRPLCGWAQLSLEQHETTPEMCIPVDVSLALLEFRDALDGAVDEMEEAVQREREWAAAKAS